MKILRSVVAVTAGMALASGCGTDGSAEEPKPDKSTNSAALKAVDPCQILTTDQLRKFDLEGPGSPYKALPWSPGCEYSGERIGVSVYTNTSHTVQSSSEKPVWATFKRVQVNGRAGAQAVTKGSTQAGICNVIFNAGGGLIKVQVSDSLGGLDECAKGLEIARAIEPDVPEPA